MRQKVFWSMLVLAALTLGLAGASRADESHQPKDRQCVRDCRRDFGNCLAAAVKDARLCRQECADVVQAAREACTADPESPECAAAREEVRACLYECADTLRESLKECRAAQLACIEVCPPPQPPPPPKDPACVRDCRRALGDCLDKARAAARTCTAACEASLATAREECTSAPRSEECRTARHDALLCLRTCAEQLNSDTRECIAGAELCVASCPTLPPPSGDALRGQMHGSTGTALHRPGM